MSGQQALTFVGQVVGSYFFGPVGGAIGGAIGSAVGATLFAEDTVVEGPRLNDLHVQLSSYGGAIPIIKGTTRAAGNVIWASDIRETVIETEQGGKGGGPTQTLREYQYHVDVAIALCAGTIEGIERIFANGVLIYDARTGTSPANVFASGAWSSSITVYPGDETQLPDPIIEAAVGVGNASAHRGTAYVVLGNLSLNTLQTATIPNFEFVVVENGTTTEFGRVTAIDNLAETWGLLGADPLPRVRMDGLVVRVIRNDLVKLFDLDGTSLGQDGLTDFETSLPPVDRGDSPTTYGFWLMWDGAEAIVTAWDTAKPRDLKVGDAPSARAVTLDVESPSTQFCSFSQCADNRHVIAIVEAGGLAVEWIRFEWTGEELIVDERGPVNSANVPATDRGAPTALFSGTTAGFAEGDLRTIWTAKADGTTNVDLFRIGDTGTLDLVRSFGSDSPTIPNVMTANASPGVYADNGICVVVGGDAFQVFSRQPTITSSPLPLATLIQDLCSRANLDPSEIDVTDLAQNCYGFVIPQTMTAAGAISSLRPAFYFDLVDSDKLRFVTRGNSSIAEVAYDDLGAGGNQSRVSVQIAQETELPARFNVRYISREGDYLIGAQSARRETTESIEITDAEIPVVLPDAVAAQVADVNLREAWAGGITRAFTTTVKYAKYEPCDVVTVDDGTALRVVRITKRVDRATLIEWESRDEDAANYSSNAVGMQILVPVQTPAVSAGPTDIEFLDLPPLTTLQSGSEAAGYVALRGFISPWAGAVVDISRDAGVTFSTGCAGSTPSVMGVALTTLANFSGGNVFDEISSVRVDVGGGTLSSSTHDLVLAGANLALVGDEIIQFRTATLVSTGVYDLTGLLRGRKGTERAMGLHATGERFVFLSLPALESAPLLMSDAASTLLRIRATTVGTSSASSSPQPFTTELARLKPYSPTLLAAVRQSDGSWSVSWVRRDRYMNDWNSGVDVPMSEATLAYDLEVWDGATLVDSFFDINEESFSVPATTFGSPTPNTLTFIVFQRSIVVGRGYPAEITVTA